MIGPLLGDRMSLIGLAITDNIRKSVYFGF